MSTKKELGQYFTTNIELLSKVKEFVKNTEGCILEPSFGQGNLIEEVVGNRPIIGYEIDKSIGTLKSLKEKVSRCGTNLKLRYTDFLDAKVKEKFTTIIANPPYCKTRNSKNLYIKFIEKCFELLDDNGEMIFIVPSDFLKATGTSEIISRMAENGSFTDFYMPNKEDLFKDATIDIVIFRYQLGYVSNKTVLNGEEKYINTDSGIISFSDNESIGTCLDELFDIYVGIVSGKDNVFANEIGNVKVVTDLDEEKKFVLISKYPCTDKKINKYLLEHKDELLDRKIRKFTENNWFEWGALRNISIMKNSAGKDCIYVRTITRKDTIAKPGKVQLFGGSLLCMIPKVDINIDHVCNEIEKNKSKYIYAGRFRITHRQLSKMRIVL